MARVAAIDCGTNSLRLLVATLGHDGGLVEVLRRMEIVRLGEGVDRTGALAPAALERTRSVLAEYVAQLKALGVGRVRMVATSATRDATNAGAFRDMVVGLLGQPPEVITGKEEARLSFDGALRGLSAPAPVLVVDIGGGSTELVLGGTADGAGAFAVASVDIGCVRLTERHLHDDPPTPGQVDAARRDIAAALDRAGIEHALASAGHAHVRTLVGLAGSVTTVTALALGLDSYQPERIHHARVSLPQVESITAALLRSTRAQRLELAAMHPGRADVIAAGALVLLEVMRRYGVAEVVASEHDLLDGIVYSMAETGGGAGAQNRLR